MIKNVGLHWIQHLALQVQVSITQQEHVIVVMRFHNPILVHQEHCLGHRVFKLYLRIGNVRQDTVFLVQYVGEELISNHLVVQMEEPYQVHRV